MAQRFTLVVGRANNLDFADGERGTGEGDEGDTADLRTDDDEGEFGDVDEHVHSVEVGEMMEMGRYVLFQDVFADSHWVLS